MIKITTKELQEELEITREFIHQQGLDFELLNYKEKHKPTKCSCYDEEEKEVVIGYNWIGKPMYGKIKECRCNGTKERDWCSCDGNKNKCDFYKENRMRRIKNDIC